MDEDLPVLTRVIGVIVGLVLAAVITWPAWSGIVYDNLGNYTALANYSKAVLLNPKDATTFYDRGHIYDELGYYDRALADYSEALRLNPEFATAFCSRARLFALQGESDEALSDLRQAFELDEANDSTTCFELTKTYSAFDSIRNVPYFHALLAEFDGRVVAR